MISRILDWFMFGCMLGAIAALMTGCALTTESRFMTQLGTEEPLIQDSVFKVGPSYGCDTRRVIVKNPMDQRIAVLTDCKCKDPKDLVIEPHQGVEFFMLADKSLDGNDQCEMAWAIAGQGAPIVSRFRPH